MKFLGNEFALEGLEILSDLNKKRFRDLDMKQQKALCSLFRLRASVLQNSAQDVQYEVFARLNQGSVQLNPQEIRNCLYHGRFNRMLKQLAEDKNVQTAFKSTNNRYSYEERILRFFALRECAMEHEDFRTYTGCLRRYLDAYMAKHMNDDADSIKKLKSLFNTTLLAVLQVLDDDVFMCISDSKTSFSGSIYDSIMIPFSFYPQVQLVYHKDEIVEFIRSLRDNNLYYACTTCTNTGNTKYTATRINIVRSGLDRIMEQDDPDDFRRYFRKDIMRAIRKDLFTPGCKCSVCGKEISDIKCTHLDHVLPWSKGGKTILDNIQLTHIACNLNKSDKIQGGVVA